MSFTRYFQVHGVHRVVLLCSMAGLALLALIALGPVAQPAHYHHFADAASLAGIPHFADVVSNIPFLVIAAAGFGAAARAVADAALLRAWRFFFAAIGLTAAGSAFYHWAPTDFTLVWDRIPIALACGALLCCFLGERVSRRWLAPHVLAGVAGAAALSVLWWYTGQRAGTGDLRPYLAFQIAPMLLIPCGLVLFRGTGTVGARWWLAALALYAVAKGFELRDHEVLHATDWVSGHTLKHLVAAMAAGCFVAGLAAVRRIRAA